MSDMRSQTPPGNTKGSRPTGAEVVSITYEEIGLFPRSFSRVLDRFLKQVFSDVENLVLREYRFYRYLFLTTVKSLLILFFVPFFVNFLVKTYVIRPLTSYFWNTQQTEVFLNSYQQKHAFSELKDFEEKLYFESLIYPHSGKKLDLYPAPDLRLWRSADDKQINTKKEETTAIAASQSDSPRINGSTLGSLKATLNDYNYSQQPVNDSVVNVQQLEKIKQRGINQTKNGMLTTAESLINKSDSGTAFINTVPLNTRGPTGVAQRAASVERNDVSFSRTDVDRINQRLYNENIESQKQPPVGRMKLSPTIEKTSPNFVSGERQFDEKTESLIHSYTLKSSLFVYQTIEADKNIQQRYQEKTIELAQRYNDQSIEAITNFFGDVVSLASLFYLLYALSIQINITKSFLLEVFFGLDDSKKSLLILLVTDLLVGYHSSNLWELFFSLIFHHYGLPESQTGIFLLVATLPVLLDVLFKYLIFRHLNRSSPATVATYHAMIE